MVVLVVLVVVEEDEEEDVAIIVVVVQDNNGDYDGRSDKHCERYRDEIRSPITSILCSIRSHDLMRQKSE